jgi:hypothetical protein
VRNPKAEPSAPRVITLEGRVELLEAALSLRQSQR